MRAWSVFVISTKNVFKIGFRESKPVLYIFQHLCKKNKTILLFFRMYFTNYLFFSLILLGESHELMLELVVFVDVHIIVYPTRPRNGWAAGVAANGNKRQREDNPQASRPAWHLHMHSACACACACACAFLPLF